MPSLSQSPLLQALGYAIAHSLWQMALVWIVYVLLNSLFKFKSEIKYRIAVAAQVVGFAWFLGTLQFYYTQSSRALQAAEAIYLESGDQSAIVFAGDKSSLLNFFIKAESVLPYLSVAYLLLLVFLTIRWFKAYRYTQIVRLNGLHKIDVDWKLFVNKVAGQLGIKQKVRIYLSELVQSPVTIGFLKPVILIPVASFTHLTPQQLEAVILHELAHIKRHDYLLNIVLSIIDLGLFFNPFTRLITKSVSKERENSCDDWVLQYQYSPAMYAEALLRIAVMQKSPVMAMSAVKTKSELASRVQRMINQKDSRFSYRHQLIALLMMTGILASIAWYDPNSIKNNDLKPTAENHTVVLEPLAAKVDNPLFNPMFYLNDALKEEVKKNVEATQKQVRRTQKQVAEIATRESQIPSVMAPVAIENLKELERNLLTINKDLKKTLVSTTVPPARVAYEHLLASTNGKHSVFSFDSLEFTNAYLRTEWEEVDWKKISEEMKTSQKSIEDAFRHGKISQLEAKKMQAQIASAMAKLQQQTTPLVFGYAPALVSGQQFYYRTDADAEAIVRERKNNDEKRKSELKEKIAAARKVRVHLDTLKGRMIARASAPSPSAAPAHVQGYRISNNGNPIIISEKEGMYVQGTQKIANVRTPATPLPKTAMGKGKIVDPIHSYTYIYTDDFVGEECDKANSTDRKQRRILQTTTAKAKSNQPVKGQTPANTCTTGTKVKTTTTTKNKTVKVLINSEDGDAVIMNVEAQ